MTVNPVGMMLVLAVAAAPAGAGAPARDGQRDFDWEIGRWKTVVRVLQNPLSGEAPQWADFRGESLVKPLLDGRANTVELSIAGTASKIEGVSLRLYNPRAGQWSLNFAGTRNGLLTAPVFGSFDAAGKGTFIGADTLDGKAILVRFVITRPTKSTARFEQAYSDDAGATWETNWVATDVLVTP